MTLRLHPDACSHSRSCAPDDERNPSVTGPVVPSFHGPTRGTARAGDDQEALALGSCGPRHRWPWAPAPVARGLRCHWPRPRYGGLRGRLAKCRRGQPCYDTTTVLAGAAATGSPGSSNTGSGGAGSGNTAPGGALVEYARCMRAHGVSSFPEPGSLSASDAIRNFKGEIVQAVGALASSPVFQAAQRACAEYYGRPTPAPQQVSPQEMQKLLAVSRCIRAHGVPDFPDPNPTTGDMNPPADISRNSPTVIAALRACQPQAAGCWSRSS